MNQTIAVGRFGGPYGVKGWIKVISYTDPLTNILEYLPWYIFRDEEKISINLLEGRVQGNKLIVQIEQCPDRKHVKTFTNLEIYIDKSQLPVLESGEYYWNDLIGLTVINCDREVFGKVTHLLATGANDVLVVKEESGKERYIPYLDHVVIEVDLNNKQLVVDWDASF